MQNTKQSTHTEKSTKRFALLQQNRCGSAHRHASIEATKYCCLGFPGGSPYKDHTLVCWTYLHNGLSLRPDLARRRILCSMSSKLHKPKDILTSEPFLPSNIIFWHRASANNTCLRVDNFQFCRRRSSGGDRGGGWWQSTLKKLVVFRGNKMKMLACFVILA